MNSYKQFTLQLAQKAAKQMQKDFVLGMNKKYKKDGSPVTKTDLAINKLVIDEVKKKYPNHSVLAEEKSYALKNSEFIWVCDPIDGTIPFSHGVPIATFTLALVKNGQPIVGIIVDPFGQNYYYAEINKGAYLNNKKINIKNKKTLVSAVVFTEYWKQAPYNTMPITKALEDINCNVPILKSIAYGCGLVATGDAAGVIFPGKNPWDIAAAKIIIEEAGGVTSDLFGKSQRYDKPVKGFIAANKTIHKKLVTLVSKKIKPIR